MVSLKAQLTFGLLAVVFYATAIVVLALSLPQPSPLVLKAPNELTVQIANEQELPITAFRLAAGERPADLTLALEEPDVLATYAQFNGFFQQHSELDRKSVV